MFAYNPKDAVMTQPDGDYPAVLAGHDEKNSAAGNPMLVVMFTVYAPDGTMCELSDYIVSPPPGSGKKSTVFKLKRIAQALGQEEAFEAGTFDISKFMGYNLTVTLGTQSQAGYDDKNTIRAYKPASATGPVSMAAAGGAPPDDDLPF